jgi:hypothetical protein
VTIVGASHGGLTFRLADFVGGGVYTGFFRTRDLGTAHLLHAIVGLTHKTIRPGAHFHRCPPSIRYYSPLVFKFKELSMRNETWRLPNATRF